MLWILPAYQFIMTYWVSTVSDSITMVLGRRVTTEASKFLTLRMTEQTYKKRCCLTFVLIHADSPGCQKGTSVIGRYT